MAESKKWHQTKVVKKSGVGLPMFMGFIGALVYYMNLAHNFGAVVTGILKSLVWPAFLVYHLLGLR